MRSENLLVRSEAADTWNFDQVQRRFQNRVAHFIRGSTDAPEAVVEELTQEVFLQVLRSAASFRGDSRFSTWLYAVARNVRNTYVKRRRIARSLGSRLDSESLRRIPDRNPSPLERLERAEGRDLVNRAMLQLSDEFRTVLTLRDWEELSYQEISEVLRIPLGTVRSRLHNARLALGRLLATRLGGSKHEGRHEPDPVNFDSVRPAASSNSRV